MKKGEDFSKNKEYHTYSTDNYGGLNSESLPNMPENTYHAIGFNDTYGLVDVIDEDTKPYFEGRIDITDLLKKLKFKDLKDKGPKSKERVELSSNVEKYVMNAYDNWFYSQNNSEEDIKSPNLEVLTYKGNTIT